MEKVTIDDIELILTRPVEQELQWIGQPELVDQILASWLVVGEGDLPLCPRLIGKPGVGKTTLAYCAVRAVGLPAYIHQCTVDTRPEDLLVTPVLSREGKISYHASPLVSAMVRGGIVILDEANRMSEKSWASLAPLLDHRRYVESIVAGIRIPAHASFRACITMNEDASTYEIPDYMLSRIQPAVEVTFPERDEEFQILKYHLPFAPEEVLELTVEFLQGAHALGLPHSTRDGINIARYAVKMRQKPGAGTTGSASWRELFERSVRQILGAEALDLKKQALVKQAPELLDLRELFAQIEEADDEDEPPDPPRGSGPRKGPGKPRA
jgi:hypothetical protein